MADADKPYGARVQEAWEGVEIRSMYLSVTDDCSETFGNIKGFNVAAQV